MSALYNEYLTGTERELAVIFAESDAQFAKLDVLFETVNATLNANMLAAEAKVFAENGTYDDLTMLYMEAGAEAADKKQGIISAIISAIRNLFAKIGNFFREKFGKTELPAEVSIDKDVVEKMNFIEKSWSNIQNGINKLKNKDVTGAWDILKSISPALITGGVVASGAVVVWKREEIKSKVDGLREKYNFLDTAIKTVEGWWNSIKNTMPGNKGSEQRDETKPDAESTDSKKYNSIGDALKDPLGFIKSIAKHISSIMGNIWNAVSDTVRGKGKEADGKNSDKPVEASKKTNDGKEDNDDAPDAQKLDNEDYSYEEESVSIFGVDIDSDDIVTESSASDNEMTEVVDLFDEL